MPYIIHCYNGASINHYALNGTLTVGRARENDIQIDDPTLSAQHAVIEPLDNGCYRIRDLNSTNGILYKGNKVSTLGLSDGDVLVLGTHDMKFVNQLPQRLEQTHKIKKSWIPGIYYTQE